MSETQREIKVLIITSRSDSGGGPKHVLDLVGALSKPGRVRIAIASPLDFPFGEKFQRRSDHLVIEPRSVNFRNIMRLRQFARDWKPDIIHSHGRGASYLSFFLRPFIRCRYFHTYHGIHSETGIAGRLKHLFDRLQSCFATYSVFSCESEKLEARRLHVNFNGPSRIIPNGVDCRANNLNVNAIAKKIRFGVVARPVFQKGLDRLIETMLEVQKVETEFQVIVAGISDGELQLPKSLEGNFRFLGPLADMSTFYFDIHVLISFARWEGMPLSVLEAFANRRLALLSNIPGHRDFFARQIAIPFDPDLPSSFIAELVRLKINPDDISKKVENARMLAMRHYDVNIIFRKLEEFYRESIDA